jgi:hypothetical protein
MEQLGEGAFLIIVDENTICIEHDTTCKNFDIHDELSPLYLKQYMRENNIQTTQCYLSSEDQQETLDIFMKNASELFEGMDSNSSFYIN